MNTNIDLIQCRASNGVALQPSQPWEAGKPVEFIYAPAGRHTITAGFRKNESITICVENDEQTALDLQASFEHLTATEPNQEPFGDEDHDARKATLRFPSGVTNFKWGQIKSSEGVIVSAEPTSYGSEAVNGKVYRSWSPEFATDAAYAKARQKNGHWTFPDGVRGSESNPARIVGVSFVMGALTNKPAFRAMPPVKAKKVEERGEIQASELTAGGFSAEEHEALGKMHGVKAERLFKSRGERESGLLGGESDKWYHANTHDMVSGYHNSAAEHLKNGEVSKAEEAAHLAAHHTKSLPVSHAFRNSIGGSLTASETAIPFSQLLNTLQAALPDQEVVNVQHEGGNEFVVTVKAAERTISHSKFKSDYGDAEMIRVITEKGESEVHPSAVKKGDRVSLIDYKTGDSHTHLVTASSSSCFVEKTIKAIPFTLADDGSVTIGRDFVSATLPEAYAGECLLNGESVKAASALDNHKKISEILGDYKFSKGEHHFKDIKPQHMRQYLGYEGFDTDSGKMSEKKWNGPSGQEWHVEEHPKGGTKLTVKASLPSIYSKAATQESDLLGSIYERAESVKAGAKPTKSAKPLDSIYARMSETGNTAPATN